MTKQKEIIIYTGRGQNEGFCRWRYRDDKNRRCTQFLPRNIFDKLGLDFDKPYKITTEEIEYDYI